MQTLRHARYLACLVLAWYVLFVGAAIASPALKPQALDVVCSAAGMVKLVAGAEGGAGQPSPHSFDCPLCVHAGLPPAPAPSVAPPLHPLSHALRPAVAAHLAALAGAPLPARGPPALC